MRYKNKTYSNRNVIVYENEFIKELADLFLMHIYCIRIVKKKKIGRRCISFKIKEKNVL